jgi:hypothetical protein
MNHFNTKDMDLHETQKQVIESLLNERRLTGEIKSDTEYDIQYKYLLSLIEAGEPMTKVRLQEGQTNPEDFNESYQEIAIDIMTAFSQINLVDKSVNQHQQLNQSIVNNLKLNLNKVSDEVSQYERLVDYLTTEDITIETFRDSNTFDTENSLYTERDGAELAPDYHAKLDIDREAIKLPTILSQNAMIGPAGVRLARIKIGTQLGGGLIRLKNPENGIDKALDTSFETFWSESLLVDSPIKVQMESNFYGIKHGAACELIVNFDYLTQINEISLLPFTEFPMEVVAIQYYESDDANEEAKEIISPTSKEALRSRTVSESTSFQFSDVLAKRLRIILNQIHFVKTDFLVNDREQKQLELWFAANREVDPEEVTVKKTYNFKPLYRNKAEANKLYTYFSKQLENMDTDLESVIGKQTDPSVSAVSKYMYNYGLYNLGARRNEYQDKGIYVSKSLPIDSSIKSITLDTLEEHPVLQNSDLVFTDIEYYVTHAENPDVEDWFPIVPKNKQKIDAELLSPKFESGEYRASLRFMPEGTIKVRKNGVEVYEWLGDFTVSGNRITILNFDVSATYTAEYIPEKKAYIVDFIEKHTVGSSVQPNIKMEEFQGTNQKGELNLSYFTFLDRAKLNAQPNGWNPTYLSNDYLPVKVKLINATGFHIDQPFSVSEQDTITVNNMTNYFDEEKTQLQPFSDELKNYQYIVSGNKLVFNTIIPEDTRVIVEYPYLVGAIRLKAILRRNIQGMYGLTPVLNEYTTHYQRLL